MKIYLLSPKKEPKQNKKMYNKKDKGREEEARVESGAYFEVFEDVNLVWT
jgi:hypothetical protein